MGEYFKGRKLGTCNNLMYVTRRELVDRVNAYPNEVNTDGGNLPYLKDYLNLNSEFMYRFEFEDELKDSWNVERDAFKTIVFEVDKDKIEVPHREFHQMHLPNGECYNVPFCFYSEKAVEFGIRKISSPSKIKISIAGERYKEECPNGYTVLKCDCCGELFSLSEDESDYVSEVLKLDGYAYESKKIKPRVKRTNISKSEFISNVIKEGNVDMIVDIVGQYDSNNDSIDKLITEKLKSFTLEEINTFSKKYLCNYNITD